ncbi:MAG: phosphoglucosamine mutase, partial [Desulfobacterales bacterium]|nr:phosphoglucosamine mutase [Desulfobacterales bacterium]
EVVEVMRTFPQTQRSIRVKTKKDLSQIPQIQNMIKQCEKELSEQGRIVVRYSGTEQLLRIMIEGENEEQITRMADTLAETAQKALG